MHVDLITLYLIAIGTLLASSVMTLWEHRAHPRRSAELRTLAAGYATLAIGCAGAANRHALPGALGSALSNLVIVGGYLLVLHGAASFNGRRHVAGSVGLLVLLALLWIVGGTHREADIWNYGSAVPIGVVCGMTSLELMRRDGTRGRQARLIAALVSGSHALFYLARAFVLPWLVSVFGPGMLKAVAQATMYEGVLYSVILPMTLLRFVREETHGRLLQDSLTDYLTGLGNRRWFFEEGARMIRDDGRAHPVSLLALDIDRFKSINDRFGHDAGDEVLKAFAQTLRIVLGADAIIARIGGEEFAAVLPRCDHARAKAIAGHFVERFARTVAHEVDGRALTATVSIGLARAANDAPALSALLASADEALYRAKRCGGNRVEDACGDTQAVADTASCES